MTQTLQHWGARLIRAAGRSSLFARSARRRMVERLGTQGIHDQRVLDAMLEVPRELFVSPELRDLAYEDRALPIDHQQSISQPYIVALMLQALGLEGNEAVLDVGTGSGYAAAVLSLLAREVHSIERLPPLADSARLRLATHGFRARVHTGDGSLGLPGHGPFDAIAVAASGPVVPPALAEQLELGGRLVMPVRKGQGESLVVMHRLARADFRAETLTEVRFVPLVGAYGEH